MRIAELSRRTGVPVPTIKYYLRDGLLSRGTPTGPNQAQYDERHVRRVALIRALVDVGGLSVRAARALLAAVDSPATSILDSLGKASYTLTSPSSDRSGSESDGVAVDEMIERLGWHVRPDNPARHTLAETLAALERLGQNGYAERLDDLAHAAEQVAEVDLDVVLRQPDLDAMAEAVVLGTVLGDALVSALRRLAQEAVATRRLADHTGSPD